MEISFSEARTGDILVFCRDPKDKVSGSLTWVLKQLDKDFAKWVKKNDFSPWHTAPITSRSLKGCRVMDALMDGAAEIFHHKDEINKQCKIYRWLDDVPAPREVINFTSEVTGSPYDIKAYFSTMFFYFVAKIFKKFYRIHDRSHHCWEITSRAMRMWGKPLQKVWEYPLISAMVKTLDE